MHYARIARVHWRRRLRLARAMGLDAVSTYVFWNRHEPRPGEYDFAGENDVAAYLRLAAEEGLDVILRPGPYVCAEWDFGGLPAWLLRDGSIPVRTLDERYMAPARRWLQRLGRELAPLQRSRGGPIVAVQVENEYGAFGADRAYMEAMRDALTAAGFGASPFYTIDQPGDLARGSLNGVPIAVTFGPGDPIASRFEAAQRLRPGEPLICAEYWAGWFDHWGEPHHRLDDAVQTAEIEWMLANRCSFNVYMLHGGTNFGFWNGANGSAAEPYAPVTTSYDYDAAIAEDGRPAPKYHRFRAAIAAARGAEPTPLPEIPAQALHVNVLFPQSVSLWEVLPAPIAVPQPQAMETWGQAFGYALYQTTLPDGGDGVLAFDVLRDYAAVFVDGERVADLDRRAGATHCELTGARAGARLDVLVENGGRINYGAQLSDERKGIAGAVLWRGTELRGWHVRPLPMEEVRTLPFAPAGVALPRFRRGTFHLDRACDLAIDTADLGKGVLWINGRNAGRFWNAGPQTSLFVPRSWAGRGSNEAVIFELCAGINES